MVFCLITTPTSEGVLPPAAIFNDFLMDSLKRIRIIPERLYRYGGLYGRSRLRPSLYTTCYELMLRI